MEEQWDCSISVSNLICQENGADLDAGEETNQERNNNELFLLLETEEEYIEKLVSREISYGTRNHYSVSSSFSCCDDCSSVLLDDWFKSTRSAAIQWILKMSHYFGFGIHTSYLAITYFDRFCLRRNIDNGKSWAVRLLSIACLSLAAKMEEYRAPSLSEYRVEEYEFSSDSIQRMELLVLSTLDWRMSFVSPFDYLNYFLSKFDRDDGSNDLMQRAVGFVLKTIEVNSVLDYRPSIIAAAAVLASSNERLTQDLVESKIHSLSLSGLIEKEHVYACYNVMNQGSERKLKVTKRLADSSVSNSSIHDSMGSIDTVSLSTTTGNKRIRLHLPNNH